MSNLLPQEWNILPGVKNKKYPGVKWKKYQDKQYPRSKLKNNNTNYLVVCGKTSNNLCAIDLDFKHSIVDTIREQEFETIYREFREEFPELSNTRIHKTPHGFHILYYCKFTPKTEHFKNLFNKESFTGTIHTQYASSLNGIDFQGEDALIVIPPSLVDNKRYKIYKNTEIRELSEEEYERVKRFFLLDNPRKMREAFIDIVNGEIEIEEYSRKAGKSRNEHIYWKFLYREAYARCDLLPEQLFSLLDKNQPIFDREKTEEQLPHSDWNSGKPMRSETYYEYFPTYNNVHNASAISLFPPEVEEEQETSTEMEDLSTKELMDIATNILLDEFDIATMRDSRKIMLKHNNYYDFNTDELLKRLKEIVDGFSKGSYTHYKSNILEMIRDETLYDRKNFCTDHNLINFQNGVYNIENGKFYEECDKDFFYCIPHKYKKGKHECPKFEQALLDWLVPKDRWPVVTIPDIYEMIGLFLSTHMGFKKSFINHGEKDSGKTQFLNIIIEVIGKDNTAAIPLQRLTKDQFGTVGLQMKLLNACGDIGNNVVRNTNTFKNLTGGDMLVPAEIKGGVHFEFTNYSKFIFNANSLPKISDINDSAFFERFIILMFPNVFSRDDEGYMLNFFETICTEEEIQGIIHNALEGLKRIIKRKGFRRAIQQNTKHIWLYESNGLYRFIKDFCVLEKGKRVLKDDFYDAFLEYSDIYLTKRKLTIELQKWGITSKRLRNGHGDRHYYYVNIRLKDNIEINNWEGDHGEVNIDRLFGGG